MVRHCMLQGELMTRLSHFLERLEEPEGSRAEQGDKEDRMGKEEREGMIDNSRTFSLGGGGLSFQ